MRRVVNHRWPVLHYQRTRSPFRLCDGTAPLCHRVATVTANPIAHDRRGRCGTR
jgi:hypothetical protein